MNIPALVAISVFYGVVIFIGFLALCKKKWKYAVGGENEDILAGRNIGCFLGTLSLTATWVGGAYISGTVEKVYRQGIVHAQVPWAYALSLLIGGLLFAKKMRKEGHMTMLDPLQEKYGSIWGGILSIPALAGELFWSAAILSSLGVIISRMLEVRMEYAIIASVFVATLYTLVGGLYAVAYTDVLQISFVFVGLWLVIPFAMMHDNVSKLSSHTTDLWLGSMHGANIGSWLDHALLLVLGRIPWQVYFQRVLSAKSGTYARVMSLTASFGCLIVAIPVVMIGIIAKSTDWAKVLRGEDSLHHSEGVIKDDRFILILVIEYLTPKWVSTVALAGICAAVMSSIDSSILSSTSMLSYNVYKIIFRKKASPREVAWITRLGVLMAGVGAGAVAIMVKKSLPDYWILSCDFVYVILFPQLLCAVFLKFVNIYGSVLAVIIAIVLRLGGGIRLLGRKEYSLPAFIKYPFFDYVKNEQVFPFRTFAMGVSILTLIMFSLLADCVRSKTKSEISQEESDILRISYRDPMRSDEKSHSFSKISRYSGSYNNIAASATELRNRDEKSLLRTSLTHNREQLENCAEIAHL